MQPIDFYSISILARNWLIRKTNAGFKEGGGMKWLEIITLRSPGNINRELVDELLKVLPNSNKKGVP
jgi:hypothetical protein